MNSVTSIGWQVFDDCVSLKRVGNLSNVTYIGNRAWFNCLALETIGDLRSVTEIGDAAFTNCFFLTIRVLPNSYAEQYAKSNNIKYTYIED